MRVGKVGVKCEKSFAEYVGKVKEGWVGSVAMGGWHMEGSLVAKRNLRRACKFNRITSSEKPLNDGSFPFHFE